MSPLDRGIENCSRLSRRLSTDCSGIGGVELVRGPVEIPLR